MRIRHVRNQDKVWLGASVIAFSERWKTNRTVVRARKVLGIAIAFFLRQFRPRDKCAMRLIVYKTLIRETKPDHNTGNSVQPVADIIRNLAETWSGNLIGVAV